MSNQWDVIVIGGGPGGSTAATMLTRWGYKVLLLEKERFPRYHIGESLLPATWQVFDALGVSDKIRAANFIPKAGGTFVWGLDRTPWTVYFGEIDGQPAARQVKRDVFDKILLDNAIEKGVDVRQNCDVKDYIEENGRMAGVVYIDSDGARKEARARWLVDASGQGKFLGRRFGLVEYHPDFKNTAVWSYWENAKRQEGYDSGNVLYVTHEHGWFWYIPLEDEKNLISVGTVIRPSGRQLIKEKGVEAFYHDTIASTDVLPGMLAQAKQVAPVRVISDYSYCCTNLYGPGWILVGDAACFVDPILSSGVQLASFHGLLSAMAINTIEKNPSQEGEVLAYYERLYKHQYNTFVDLCKSMYDTQKQSKEGYFAAARKLVQPTTDIESSDHDRLGDRLAFISLISGTRPEETQRTLRNFFMSRKKANKVGEDFSEEALSMLFSQVHRKELRRGRLQRIGEDEVLRDNSLLRLGPGVEVSNEIFLPRSPMQNTLQRQEAVKNRFGDRFEATREMRALLAAIDGRRTYTEVLNEFCRVLETEPQGAREPFRHWVELMADYGLVEWQNL